MKTHMTRLIVGLIAVALLVGPFSVAASADPGRDNESGTIIVEKSAKLMKAKRNGIQPAADSIIDLGGGVTATSTAGMTWGSNPFGEDVRGLTKSSTTSTIDTVHTHGALVREGNADAQNCYEGVQEWTPDLTFNWTTVADSGWGPQFSGFHDCWVMATGHYYIFGGVRTDVVGPDIIKRF